MIDVPFVIAHRGAAGIAPENTLAAISRAADLGARWVEVDVRCTADGVPVVIHDQTLDRTTDGKGPVGERTSVQLASLDAGTWFDPGFAGARIPTLSQVLAACADRGLGLNAELKPAGGDEIAVAQAVAEQVTAWRHPLLVSSADHALLAAFHRQAPGVALAALYRSAPSPDDVHRLDLPLAAVSLSRRGLGRADVSRLAGTGLAVLVYTVNKVAEARRLRDWGVDGVFTDHPQRLLAAFAGEKGGLPR